MMLAFVEVSLFQFTHPGGVRLPFDMLYNNCGDVSIHAPGRGATDLLDAEIAKLTVSIHAPGRGATAKPVRARLATKCFNSRTREGCDGVANPRWTSHTEVSIHAPGRGATRRCSTSEQ